MHEVCRVRGRQRPLAATTQTTWRLQCRTQSRPASGPVLLIDSSIGGEIGIADAEGWPNLNVAVLPRSSTSHGTWALAGPNSLFSPENGPTPRTRCPGGWTKPTWIGRNLRVPSPRSSAILKEFARCAGASEDASMTWRSTRLILDGPNFARTRGRSGR